MIFPMILRAKNDRSVRTVLTVYNNDSNDHANSEMVSRSYVSTLQNFYFQKLLLEKKML